MPITGSELEVPLYVRLTNGTIYRAGITGLSKSTADGLYVGKIAEQTLEGPLILDRPAASDRMLMIRSSGSNRWFIGSIGGTEPGSNAGSTFVIARFDDAGVWIDTVLSINRATGVVTFPKGFAFSSQITAGSDINMNGFALWGLPTPVNPSDAATKGYTDGKITTHEAAADPHTGYQKETEKAAANGYASLDGTTKVPIAQVPTGTTGTTVSLGNHAHAGVYDPAGTASSAITTHEAAADPHTGYQRETEKAAANGYASLDASTKVPIAQVPTGTSSTTVLLGNTTLNAITAPTAAVSLNSQQITNLAPPTANTDAVNRDFVDARATKDPVKLVTTANWGLSGLGAIDGTTPVSGDRILVTAQATASQNGIYIAASGAWTRAIDMDATGDLADGTLVPVARGTANADSLWICTGVATTPWVPGTHTSTWVKYHAADLAARVLKAGDTMTGNLEVGQGTATPNLTIKGSTSSMVVLDTPTATNTDRNIRYRTNGVDRWSVGAEPDAGALFSISAFNDAGSWAGNAVEILRSDQLLKLKGDPTAALHAATKQYVDTNGFTRTVSVISGNTTLSATKADYVYVCTAALTATLPTAVGNKNMYTVKRTGTGNVTVATTASQTIDGAANFLIDVQYQSIDVISDGANWVMV